MPLKDQNEITLEGFDSKDDFCKWVMETRQNDLDFDRENRDRGIQDTRYAAGYQWPAEDYKWRVDNNIPAMTFNQVPSLLRHRLGARARKAIGPKVTPVNPGKRYDGIAQIREGLIRNVEMNSDIKVVDATISQQQLIGGIGNYEVTIEYANNDVFETDIFIRTDQNSWSVIWDSMSQEPTGKDARHVMKETNLTRKDYEAMFPDYPVESIGENPAHTLTNTSGVMVNGQSDNLQGWINEDTVRIALVWTMHERDKTLALLTNGDVVDIGDTPPEEYQTDPNEDGDFDTVVRNQKTGEYKSRVAKCKYARGVLTNGSDMLGEPYEMEVDRVPLVRVPAWCIYTGDRMERFGMIYNARDALTFYNYVKSDRIERIVFRNRAQYEAQEDALSAEQEKQYKNAHRLRGGVLKYRGPAPMQISPPPVDQAAIIETEAAQQSINDIFDIRPGLASGMGAPSGISLEHQMDITDTGGLIYDETMEAAKREVYRLINQLIPYVYDAPRIIKIVGEDGKIKEAILNDPENPESIDITLGKYSVDTATGPSAATQRVQAIDFYQTMFNANPELMGLVAPELIELLNVPGTEKLSKALRERTGTGQEEDLTPEEQAAMAAEAEKQAALEEKMVMLQMRSAELDVEKKQAETEARLADVQQKLATAESERAQSQERLSKAEQDRITSTAKILEMESKMELLAAQTEKVLAEIQKINATPIPNPTGGTTE